MRKYVHILRFFFFVYNTQELYYKDSRLHGTAYIVILAVGGMRWKATKT